nr:hypothetical protein [Polymorphobacter sp.]
MKSIIIVAALNLALLGWVLWLIARDPGKVFKRRRGDDDETPGPDEV